MQNEKMTHMMTNLKIADEDGHGEVRAKEDMNRFAGEKEVVPISKQAQDLSEKIYISERAVYNKVKQNEDALRRLQREMEEVKERKTNSAASPSCSTASGGLNGFGGSAPTSLG